VQDHIDFVLRVRGTWGRKELETKRNALLREVELRAKKRTRAGALSGGMRRRLSVALAFAGDPKHVVLDEPTAGVDPRARRQIQALVKKKAKGKAVLITTHHLDEAERLGTRVAVLHQGSLVCAGSSKELKTKYDVGYRLVVTLTSATSSKRDGKESVAARLLSLFASETPPPISDTGTTVHTDRGVARDGAEGAGEVSFAWPGSLAGYLPAALRALAREKEALGVAGYGLAAPSLDGVFKAVLEENETSAASDEKRTAVREPLDETSTSTSTKTRSSGSLLGVASGSSRRPSSRCFSRRFARSAATALGSSRRSSRRRFCFSRRRRWRRSERRRRRTPPPSTFPLFRQGHRKHYRWRFFQTAPSFRSASAPTTKVTFTRNSTPRLKRGRRSRRFSSSP
jgi:hypothetical protein